MSKKSQNQKYGNIHIGLIGNHGSGKSAIQVRFLTNRFIGEYSSCINETVEKVEVVDGQTFNLIIRDCDDSEDSYNGHILGWADVVLAVFSITSRTSYYRALEVAKAFSPSGSASLTTPLSSSSSSSSSPSGGSLARSGRRVAASAVVWLLMGNKADLADLRLVDTNEALEAATAMRMQYRETSAIMNYGSIRQAVHQAVRLFLSSSLTTTALQSTVVHKSSSISSRIPDSLPQLTRRLLPLGGGAGSNSVAGSGATNSNSGSNKCATIHSSNGSNKLLYNPLAAATSQDNLAPAKKNSMSFRFFSKKSK